MNYLLKAIKQDLAERTKDIWELRSEDLKLDEKEYAQHYADMGKFMYRIEAYTKVSEVFKDIESGDWGAVALDNACEDTMTDWWTTVGRQATRLYNKEEFE